MREEALRGADNEFYFGRKKRNHSARHIGRSSEKSGSVRFRAHERTIVFPRGKAVFSIVTETENVAEFFMDLFGSAFKETLSVARASMDKMSGRDKLVLQCPVEHSGEILARLGLLKRGGEEFSCGILKKLVADKECALAYIKGAFLGGGSCIVPGKEGGKTGYHLEFVFPEKRAADDFRRLLDDAELLAKVVERNGCAVVYIKSKETISDFLSVVGAANALKKFSHLVEKRDEANNSNRAANCFSGNADKSATAAVRQVLAIRAIEETSGLDSLETELKETAEARLNNPALSLKELAQRLGISKSCLNHRMRKIEEISARGFQK